MSTTVSVGLSSPFVNAAEKERQRLKQLQDGVWNRRARERGESIKVYACCSSKATMFLRLRTARAGEDLRY